MVACDSKDSYDHYLSETTTLLFQGFWVAFAPYSGWLTACVGFMGSRVSELSLAAQMQQQVQRMVSNHPASRMPLAFGRFLKPQ